MRKPSGYYEQADLWGEERESWLEVERAEKIISEIPKSVTSVLDIGCGDGVIASRLLVPCQDDSDKLG